jgi:ABC-type multidrug transport system ATPase subunit
VNTVLEVEGLTKKFKAFTAVDDLSFSVSKGDIYGFLGQNGSGKSTTMRMVLGLVLPDKGSISINGIASKKGTRQELKHVGALIEKPDMYGNLTGMENLKMFARLSGKAVTEKRLKDVIGIVNLQGKEHKKVANYSLGMKQRLGIAIAIAHEPDLLILDEPTNGLDPQGIAEIRELINYLGKEVGNTILVSSHLLSEIEQVANKMLILHHGVKIQEGLVHDLLRPEETLVKITTDNIQRLLSLVNESAWSSYFNSGTKDTVTLKIDPARVPELNRWLVGHDVNVYDISAVHSLEHYFLNITQHATAKN